MNVRVGVELQDGSLVESAVRVVAEGPMELCVRGLLCGDVAFLDACVSFHAYDAGSFNGIEDDERGSGCGVRVSEGGRGGSVGRQGEEWG